MQASAIAAVPSPISLAAMDPVEFEWIDSFHNIHDQVAADRSDLLWLEDPSWAPFVQSHVSDAKKLLGKAIDLRNGGEIDSALATYATLIDRYIDNAAIDLFDEVAKALLDKGVLHGQLGQHDKAIETYDRLLFKTSQFHSPALNHRFAGALYNKAVEETVLNRFQEALACYDELLSRFGDDNDSEIFQLIARTLINKGVVLYQRGEGVAALQLYDELLVRMLAADDPALQELIAQTFNNRAYMLYDGGHHAEAIKLYEEVIIRFSDAGDFNLLRHTESSLSSKAYVLYAKYNLEQALDTYEYLISWLKLKQGIYFRDRLLDTLLNKSHILERLERLQESNLMIENVATLIFETRNEELLQRFGEALVSYTVNIKQLIGASAALNACSASLDIIDQIRAPVLHTATAKIIANKALSFIGLNDFAQASTTYDQLIERFEHDADPVIKPIIAWAFHNKGLMLANNHSDWLAAIIFYDLVIERFDLLALNDGSLHGPVSATYLDKGKALHALGLRDKALTSYNEAIVRFSDSVGAAAHNIVPQCLYNLGLLLSELGRVSDVLLRDEIIYKLDLRRYNDAYFDIVSQGITAGRENYEERLRQEGRMSGAIDIKNDLDKLVQNHLTGLPADRQAIVGDVIAAIISQAAGSRSAEQAAEGLALLKRNWQSAREATEAGLAVGILSASSVSAAAQAAGGEITHPLGGTATAGSPQAPTAGFLRRMKLKERREFLDSYYKNRTPWIETRGDQDPTPADLLAWADKNFPDRRELGLVLSDLQYLDKAAYYKVKNWARSKHGGGSGDIQPEFFGFPSKIDRRDSELIIREAPTGAEVFAARLGGDPDALVLGRRLSKANYRRKKRGPAP